MAWAGPGEQFGFVVDEHALAVILDRLRACFSEPVVISAADDRGGSGLQGQAEVQVQVAASIGVAATAPIAGAEQQTVEKLLRAADEAMYRAKRAHPPTPQREVTAATSNVIVLDSVVHVLAPEDRGGPQS